MNTRITCTTCLVDYTRTSTGVTVLDVVSRDESFQPHQLTMADVHTCPGCGHRVLAGYSDQPFVRHVDVEDFKTDFSSTEKVYLVFEKPDHTHKYVKKVNAIVGGTYIEFQLKCQRIIIHMRAILGSPVKTETLTSIMRWRHLKKAGKHVRDEKAIV